MENLYLKKLREKEENLENQLIIVRSMIDDELRKSNEINGISSLSKNSPKETSEVHISGGMRRTRRPLGTTIPQKFLNVLKEKQRFMKVREIAQAIVIIPVIIIAVRTVRASCITPCHIE